MFLAPLNRCAKNIRVSAIIVAELKFSDVQRHIFGGHFVERADATTFENRPKTFNRVSVNRADHILLLAVINRLVIVSSQAVINFAFISRQQANLVGNHFANESLASIAANVADDASDDIAFTLYGTDDCGFGGRPMLASAAFAVPMFVLVFSSDEAFVNLDNAAKLFDVFDQSGSDFVAHEPGGLVATEAHVTHDLQGAHTFLAGKHEVGDLEPVAERLVGVLENGPGKVAEPIAVFCAFFALPMPFTRRQVVDSRVAATRAADALRPSTGYQIGFAGIFVREGRFELGSGHLRDGFGTVCHDSSPSIEPYSHIGGFLSSAGYSPL